MYCCWRSLSDGSIVDKIFSIFSASVGYFPQKRSFELILWTSWLYSPMDLKSWMRRWVQSWNASSRTTAFCCTYLVLRASNKWSGDSSSKYSDFTSMWIWCLIMYKATYFCSSLSGTTLAGTGSFGVLDCMHYPMGRKSDLDVHCPSRVIVAIEFEYFKLFSSHRLPTRINQRLSICTW